MEYIKLTEKGEPGEPMEAQIDLVKKRLFELASLVRYFENISYIGHVDSIQAFHQNEEMYKRYLDNKETTNFYSPKVQTITLFNAQDIYTNSYGTYHFDIFSILLCQYARLLAIQELKKAGKNYDDCIENKEEVKNKCKKKIEEIVPKEVRLWRNKVAAHYALSDPRSEDNIATLIDSINTMPAYNTPYYEVAAAKTIINGEESLLEKWSLTKVFDDLAKDHWGDLSLEKLLYNPNSNKWG